MLNNLKSLWSTIASVSAAIFGILFFWKKSQFETAKRKGVEEAREIEHEAYKQMEEDLKNESKVNGDITDGKFLD